MVVPVFIVYINLVNIVLTLQEDVEMDSGLSDSHNIPGWDKVGALAVALMELKQLQQK